MNTLDIIICVILGFCFIRGIFRGLIREFASIIGVFAGLYGAYTFYPSLGDKLSFLIRNAAYQNIVAFLLIFCAILFATGLLGNLIRYILKAVFVGWIDHIVGSLFGITKGLLIASVVLVVLTAFLPKKAPVIKQSVLAPYVIRISNELVEIMPNNLYEYFKENLKELEEDWIR